MSNGKLPKIRVYAPGPVDSLHRVERPFDLQPWQSQAEPPRTAMGLEMPADIYREVPSQADTIQIATSSEEMKGIWRKPAAETSWQDNPSQKISPDQVAKMFQTHIDNLKSNTSSLHYTAGINLVRLASEHLEKGSPHVEETFAAAEWLLIESIRAQHLGDRYLAAKLMIHINPLLPDVFPPAHKTAEMLRGIIIEQKDDAATHIHAYVGLIHCFSPYEIEVTEGLVIFEGLATMGRTDAICEEARVAYWEMTEIRSPKLHRRPTPQP